MARLPIPGQDDGTWGDVLNDYLSQAHTAQGTLKSNIVGPAQLQNDAVTGASIADGTVTETQLSSAVQAKLNSGEVSSVNTRTGAVTLTKSDVGLANVDNTSDADKPISTAVQTVLDTKANAADVGAKVLLIDNVAALPPGTPAGVVVVVKA